jgi:hypothetical protein
MAVDPEPSSGTFHLLRDNEKVYYLLGFLADPEAKGINLHGFFCREGLGMNYSTTEQPTGDTWLNNKPIFQCTYTGTVNLVAGNNIAVTFTGNFENIISYDGVLQIASTYSSIIPTRSVDNSESANHTICDITHSLPNGNLNMTIRPSVSFNNARYYITVRYTRL